MKILITKDLIEKFWEKVEDVSLLTDEDCWLWIAAKDKDGYGKIRFTQRKHNPVDFRAHRLSYLMFKGSLSDILVVAHSCDNPPCINPNHLILKTSQANTEERDTKNRNFEANLTHCVRSHEFTEENTRITPSGKRECKICKKLRDSCRSTFGFIKNRRGLKYGQI